MTLRVERLDDRLTPTALAGAADLVPTPPPADELCMGDRKSVV